VHAVVAENLDTAPGARMVTETSAPMTALTGAAAVAAPLKISFMPGAGRPGSL